MAAEAERALVSVLRKALDPNVGLLTSAVQIPVQAGDPLVHICVVRTQNPTRVSPRSKAPSIKDYAIYGTGVGLDKVSAGWSALGEACERYAGSIYDPDELITCRFAELPGEGLDPAEVILHSQEQYSRPNFPIRKYDANEPITWTRGINLTTGRDAWIPASLAFMSFMAKTAGDNFVKYASTGLAAGPDYASALCSSICEVLERDAYMCHWLLKRTPPCVPVERLDRKHYQILDSTGSIELNIRDITTDIGVPCFYVGGRSPHANGVFSGASCHISAGAAVTKALYECCHTYSWGHQLLRQYPVGIEVKEIRQFEDHVTHYLNPDAFEKTSFMFENSEPSKFMAELQRPPEDLPSPEKRLKYLLMQLKKCGYAPYAVDATTDDVRELGLVVTKVVIPGLHPLHAGYGMEHADTRRLARVAKHFGLTEPFQIYDYPHPFP